LERCRSIEQALFAAVVKGHLPRVSTAGTTTWCKALGVDAGISKRLGNVPRMPIKLGNVGIAVRDLEATIAFFTDLGLIT
jgi:hypothetical protein